MRELVINDDDMAESQDNPKSQLITY